QLFFFVVLYSFIRKIEFRNSMNKYGLGLLWVMIGCGVFVFAQSVTANIGPYLSPHFLYFASVEFCLILSETLLSLSGMLLRRIVLIVICVYYVTILMSATYHWTSEERLLSRVAAKESPRQFVAQDQLWMRYHPNKNAVISKIKAQKDDVKKSLWLKRLGNIYRKKSQYPQAVQALNDSIMYNPYNLDARNELAVCYLEKGNEEDGRRILTENLHLDPHYYDTHRLLGILEYKNHHYHRAYHHFRVAYQMNPDHLEVAGFWAMVNLMHNQPEKYWKIILSMRKRFYDRDILNVMIPELYDSEYYQQIENLLRICASKDVNKKTDEVIRYLSATSQITR
ncbi:MAG: tetratricopeptide repeat protein, partial [Candidatus Omnitrophica bacterium]|nr:tetratricopeptide repeat protein [Candidatus Omnitrophota bacterium]